MESFQSWYRGAAMKERTIAAQAAPGKYPQLVARP
jgi:hypothetical protein